MPKSQNKDLSMTHISFGTSGHRGIMGDTFTHEHVKAVARGVASFLKEHSLNPTCVIGSDPRNGNDPKLSEKSFTKTCIDTLNSYGVNTISYSDFVPTPFISWAITHYAYDGGLILTASHNPPEYNGIKFNPKNGAPAPKIITEKIETYGNQTPSTLPLKPGIHKTITPPLNEFVIHLKKHVTALGIPLPKKFSKSLDIDVKHGACGNTWKHIASNLKLPIILHHETPDSQFGNTEPNPTHYDALPLCNESSYFLCANDPDGDRHAVVTATGTPITPEEITAIIMTYLIAQNRAPNHVVSTLASSHIIKYICQHANITYNETAVGFKYFAPYFENAHSQGTITLGVESSGGFSASVHTFEKCGFFPILCLLGIIEATEKPIDKLCEELYLHYGKRYFVEHAIRFDQSKKQKIQTFLTSTTPQNLKPLLLDIETLNQIDGLKIVCKNDNWVLCRLSGTEPVARIYAETQSETDSKKLIEKIETLIKTL